MAVRRESVVLDLDDRVTPGLARIAAAAEITKQRLDSIGGSQSVTNLDRTNSKLGETERALGGVEREATKAERGVTSFGSSARRTAENDFSKAANSVDGFIGSLGAIPTLAVTAGAALVPLAAAATGVVAAFAAPIAFTGGALTLFGFLGGQAISATQKQYKQVDELQKKLAGLTKGTKEYTQVQKQLHAANAAISPQQQAFHNSLETLKSDFNHFLSGPTGHDLLGPFTKGLQVADDLLPKSAPLIHAVAGALTDLLGELDKYANTPGFDRFIHQVAQTVGPDLKALGHIIGDVAPGLGNLLLTLDHRLSAPLIHDIESMAKSFGKFASSKQGRHDVQSFIDYVHKVGPDVAGTLESLAKGAGHLVKALAPLGPPVLHVVKGIADAISKIPTPVLTGLATATAGLVAFGKLGGFKAAAFVGNQAFGSKSGPLGGIPGVGGAGKGVVPVYVTNKGFGLPGGGTKIPGMPDVPPGEGAGPLQWALPVTAAVAIGAAIHQGAFDAANKIWPKIMPPGFAHTLANLSFKVPGQVGFPGFGGPLFSSTPHLNPVQVIHAAGDAFKWLGHVASETFKPIPHEVEKSVGTPLEALHQKLSKASQGMELVGHSADRAFNGGAADVQKLSARLTAVKTAPAQQQMELVGTAAQRGFSKAGAAADQLQGHVNNLHGKQIDVTVNGGQSLSVLRSIAAEEAAIRSKTITLTTIHATGGHSVGGNADGGTIGGARYPYGDKVLTMLAPGEEVISNRHGQADRYRPWLKAMNAGHFASGGTVGTHAASTYNPTLYAADLHSLHAVRAELKKLKDALSAATKELDKDRAKRQQLVQARAQLASTVRGNFRSDLFGVQANPSGGIWGAGAGALTDPAQILRHDIHDARAYTNDIKKLRARGLSKAALANITNLDQAQQAMGLSNNELHQISRLYAIRQRVSGTAGATAGNMRYSEAIHHQTAVIHRQAQDVHTLTQQNKRLEARLAKIEHAVKHDGPHNTGKAINHASGKATRRARK